MSRGSSTVVTVLIAVLLVSAPVGNVAVGVASSPGTVRGEAGVDRPRDAGSSPAPPGAGSTGGGGAVDVAARTIVVDDSGGADYEVIQNAVDNATDGDRVEVRPGTYRAVTVEKNITLIAPQGARIDGTDTAADFGILIPAGSHAEPRISGFTVTGFQAVRAYRTRGDWVMSDLRVFGNSVGGIALGSTTGDWTVRNATIVDNGQYGIGAVDSTGNWTVIDSVIRNHTDGVWARDNRGRWSVHRSVIDDNSVGVNANGATPAGDATRNWWGGTTDDPDPPNCRGNVNCSNALSSPPEGAGANREPNLTVRTSTSEVPPGENATVDITFQAGDSSLERVDAQMEFGEPVDRDGWPVVDFAAERGEWFESDRYFAVRNVSAGENVTASVTVAVPNGTDTGEYDVRFDPGYALNGTEYGLAPVNATVNVTAGKRNGTANRTALDLSVEFGRGATDLTPGRVEPGGTLPVAFRVRNAGDANVTDLRLRVSYDLPAGFSVRSAGAGGGSWNLTAGVWERGALAPGETAEPALAIDVPPDAEEGTIQAILARASDGNGTRLADAGGLFGVVNASAANAAPTAAFVTNVSDPVVGQPVRFDANASTDPDGDPLGYRWDLDGDRTFERTGERVAHRYAEPGNYSVALVVDDGGRVNATTRTLSVGRSERDVNLSDSNVSLEVGNVTALAGGEAVVEIAVGNNGSANLSDVGLEVGRRPAPDSPFESPDGDGLPAGLEIDDFRPAGGTWNTSAKVWSKPRLGPGEETRPGLTVAVDGDVSSDALEIPLRATVDGEVVATETATVDVLPVFNGLFPARVDGQFVDREWTEGHERPVTLVPEDGDGGDVQGRLHAKTADGRLYLGLRASGTGWLDPSGSDEALRRVRIELDRDGDENRSAGDVRITTERITTEQTGDSLFDVVGFEIYRDGGYEDADLGSLFAFPSVHAAPDPAVSGDTVLEVGIPTGAIDFLYGDPAARAHPGERVGVSVTVQTVSLGDSLTTPIESTEYRVTSATDPGATYPVSGVEVPRERWSSELEGPRVDAELDHVEITQAVQRPNNSLSTVRGKRTLGRAFLTHNRSSTRVRVEFTAWDTSGAVARYLGTDSVAIDAPGSFDRAAMGDSANLELPAAWRNRGQLMLRVAAYPLDRIDVGGGDDAVTESKRFVRTHDLVVYRVPVNTGTQSNPTWPSAYKRDTRSETFEAAFPVASPRFVDLQRGVLGHGYDNLRNDGQRDALIQNLSDLGNRLRQSEQARVDAGAPQGAPAPDQVYGINDGGAAGLSDPSWLSGDSLAAFGTAFAVTMAHEINHNVGNNTWGRHVANSTSEANRGILYGACGGSNYPAGPDDRWQRLFDDGDIHSVGWNADASRVRAPDTADVMTYCTRSPGRWTSDYRWRNLVERLADFEPGVPTHPDQQGGDGWAPFGATAASGASTAGDLPGSNETVLGAEVPTTRRITGTLGRDGTGRLGASFEEPGPILRGNRSVENATARVRVVRRNGPNETVPVAVSFVTAEGSRLERTRFGVTVQDNGTIRRIELLDADTGEVLDAREAANWTLDRAAIRTPDRFERGNATRVGIDLETTNISTDRLRLKLLYSPAGETGFWYPYRPTIDGRSVNATFTELPGNESARFLLLVSDGVRTEFVTSDPFAVPHLPPEVSIDRGSGPTNASAGNDTSAANGSVPAVDTTVGGTVSLEAQAQTESGTVLDGARLQWLATDADGTVVARDGGSFDHRFRAPGEYRVRVVAVDPRTGLTGTDSVRVDVSTAPVPDNETVRAFESAIDGTVSGVPRLSTAPSEVAVLVGPGETRVASFAVAETGGRASVLDGRVAATTLRNGAGTTLSAAGLDLSVERGRFAVAPNGRERVNATVAFPGRNRPDDASVSNDVPDDEPTRFDGTLRVVTGNAGSRRVNASVLALDAEVRNVSLRDADRTVEGIHVYGVASAAVVDGEWPRNVTTRGTFEVVGSGTGNVTLRVENLSDTANLTAVAENEDGDRYRLASATGPDSLGFELNVSESPAVVALVDRGARSGDDGGDESGGDGGDGGGGGGGQPGRGADGEVEIADRTLLNGSVTTDAPVLVRVDLANYDPARGTVTLNLSANGSVVVERTVAVGASTERAVFLRHAFERPGTYTVAVNGVTVGTVAVTEAATPTATRTPTPTSATGATETGRVETASTTAPDTDTDALEGDSGAETPTTSDDGAGFGVLVTLVAALLFGLGARRRRT